MVIKIEGGVGKRTVPLLIVESSFSGEVKDWSSKLSVESTLKLEVAYYNEKLSVWEPLLEPVLDEKNKMRRWEIGLEVIVVLISIGLGFIKSLTIFSQLKFRCTA